MPTDEDYKIQNMRIRKAARAWSTTIWDPAVDQAATSGDARKLLRLSLALGEHWARGELSYKLYVDAWEDWKGAAMRACKTQFDTWGDIEKSGIAGSKRCLALIDLKNAIEAKGFYKKEESNG
jgi:hypothetical protein